MTLQKHSISPKEELISNEFICRLGEWVCIHDEQIHFKGRDLNKPDIKFCSQTLRIRANQAFKALSKADQENMCAHEIGHREYQHHLSHGWMPRKLERILCIAEGGAHKNEIEADRHAAKLVGRERYLSFLKERMNETPHNSDFNEFKYRIKALEEL